MRAAVALLGLVSTLHAQDRMQQVLARLADEAETFLQVAPKTLSQETLEQRAKREPPRFRPRVGSAATERPALQFQTRTIVSEYGYSTLEDSPNALHEFRQVISVDGRKVRSQESARRTLTRGVQSRDDRLKRGMVDEFKNRGVTSVAVDLGQVIALFTKRKLADYQFLFAGPKQLAGIDASSFSFRQVDGAASVTVFEGRQARRQPLQGELWVREPDLQPLRIVLLINRQEDGHLMRDETTVDYAMSAHGVLLPATIVHRVYIDERLDVENLFRYAPFRRFGAESEIKYKDVAPEPKAKP